MAIDSEPASEQIVATIWERQSFDDASLRAMDISVVFRGVPSDAGGPDYQDAVLALGGRDVVSGDIEFHILTSDWYRHGHHHDPHYNGVVLHVVWRDDLGVTERADGNLVPILPLGLCARIDRLPEMSATTGRLVVHPCVSAFSTFGIDALREQLRRLGMRRFAEKSDGFSADMTEGSADQVLYSALLEALGFASNREVFRELANGLPYWWLATVPASSRADVLLDAAGLGERTSTRPPIRLASESWRLARVRPTNHPAIRLQGIAALLARFGPKLAYEMTEVVLRASGPADLREALMVGDASGSSLIGAGRADEIAVSVVLPFVAAYEGSAAAEALYGSYPSAPSNRWTRTMAEMFQEAGHRITPRSAPEHQGIHHLYHRHCRYERRSGCPICG